VKNPNYMRVRFLFDSFVIILTNWKRSRFQRDQVLHLSGYYKVQEQRHASDAEMCAFYLRSCSMVRL
jgi:hypothetical protein